MISAVVSLAPINLSVCKRLKEWDENGWSTKCVFIPLGMIHTTQWMVAGDVICEDQLANEWQPGII